MEGGVGWGVGERVEGIGLEKGSTTCGSNPSLTPPPKEKEKRREEDMKCSFSLDFN